MTARQLFWLIVLVSSAHALVHVYELSLPSVELEVAREYSSNAQAGKAFTGSLSFSWRLLWGFGALVAGWLVDRYGANRMLALYLLGCGASCALVAVAGGPALLTVAMITMGAFASIYHPAGLTLISHQTDAASRPRALGLHGIFGSAGISAAPFLAGSVLAAGLSWRDYYWLLTAPGIALAMFFISRTLRGADAVTTESDSSKEGKTADDDRGNWRSYFTLTVLALLQGFVYSAMMSFLPRYLSGWKIESFEIPVASVGSYLAAAVLLVGCVGQFLAGRFARPGLLEIQLAAISFGNAPFLIWMATAQGDMRPLAAACFALVHFMNQPIYNSLIASYTPRRLRSRCYGFSFAMAFGVGGFGPLFAGRFQNDLIVYGTLAGVASAAGCLGLVLWALNRCETTAE